MTYLFYSVGIIWLMYELTWIVSPRETLKKYEVRKDLISQFKNISWEEMPYLAKDAYIQSWLLLLLLIWVFTGLLSSQWVLFAGMVLLIILASAYRPASFTSRTIYHWVMSVISFVLVLFILINKFHLHIDILELISRVH